MAEIKHKHNCEAAGGTICPACDSSNIEMFDQINTALFFQCNSCGADWKLVFTVLSVELIDQED